MNMLQILFYFLGSLILGSLIFFTIQKLVERSILKEAQADAQEILKEAQDQFQSDELERTEKAQEIELDLWGKVEEAHLIIEEKCTELDTVIQTKKKAYEEAEENRIAKSPSNDETDFCEFKDGSLVSSWSAYYKTNSVDQKSQ